jgi:hypothetical protein
MSEGEFPRYLLFGSDLAWSATPDDKIDGRVSLDGCIALAKEVRLPYMIVIDRYYPRVPIYLDYHNNYSPIEDFSKL